MHRAGLAPLVVNVADAAESDAWDLLEVKEQDETRGTDTSLVVAVVISTWTGGIPPVSAQRWFDPSSRAY